MVSNFEIAFTDAFNTFGCFSIRTIFWSNVCLRLYVPNYFKNTKAICLKSDFLFQIKEITINIRKGESKIFTYILKLSTTEIIEIVKYEEEKPLIQNVKKSYLRGSQQTKYTLVKVTQVKLIFRTNYNLQIKIYEQFSLSYESIKKLTSDHLINTNWLP